MSNHAANPAKSPLPWGLHHRSSDTFIICTVAVGLFTDMFLYGLVVPVLPFMLRDRLGLPEAQIQSQVSNLLAVYAGSQVLLSLPAGWLADRIGSRQGPFLSGLAALLGATVMLALGSNLETLLLARVLQGVSGAVVWTIGLAMVMDTVGPKRLGVVIGSIFSFISVGELLAPVFGGILYDKTGYRGVFSIALALLAIDFAMRLLIIEKKAAALYLDDSDPTTTNPTPAVSDNEPEPTSTEETTLLPKPAPETYVIGSQPNRLIRAIPILYCLRSLRLVVGLSLAFIQALLIALFDATIPIEAASLFRFSAMKAGFLFIALDIPLLVLGPLAGRAVDKYGVKLPTVIGYAYLVPALVLLRLPSDARLAGGQTNVALYCVLLALNGAGLALIGSSSIVESSHVVQRFDEANPGFFGENGPYAQLYGLNSMFFCAGLTVGPVVAGRLRESVGYGNMNAVFAAVAGITAVVAWRVVGGRPARLWGAGVRRG